MAIGSLVPGSRIMAITALFFYLAIALFASSAAADDIHGCGGFVEASSHLVKSRKASVKLDYSDITGSFILRVKGPNGWSWEPNNVPVVVDHNGCNGNADINFRFTGFMISGKVVGAVGGESCSLKDRGPSGVKVELLSPSDDVIASVLTSARGDYSFTNILPGKYKLQASHPDLEIKLGGSPEVNLGFGNVVVDDVFFAAGYDLHGFVVAQGNPILGVHMYLYSDDVSEVHCPQGSGNAPRQGALCHAVTDADGKFTFRSIPCGVYELLPYYKGENTIFDVSPPLAVVSVEHSHLKVPQKFQVTGFSVGGRVVDTSGTGVEGVKIRVDGQLRAMTDNLGYYKLDQVTSKEYSITAEKDHYKFNSLENFLVLPNMASIDDIKAAYYDLCGSVRIVTANSKAMVTLTHGPENVKPQKKLVNENGSFCFEVPAGEYRLSALAVDSESSRMMMFSPSFVDVKVNSPLLDVEFFQSQVNIGGKVICKEKCNPNISLSLVRVAGEVNQESKTTTLSHESSDFMFTKVFPGKYQLEIKQTPSTKSEDNWCWDQKSIDLDVGSEDVTGIVFVQKGYWIDIISTHDTDAYIRQSDSSEYGLLIKQGPQRICVENPGKHELHFVHSCISFGTPSIEFDTLNQMPIYLSGKKYLVKGEIHVDSSLHRGAADLSEYVVVDAFKRDGSFIETISTRFALDKNDQNGMVVYEYSTWADLGGDFIFVPRDSSTSREKKILFYPTQRQSSVTISGCQDTIPAIVGRVGLYLEGSVSPALSGVSIRVIATEKSTYTPLDKGGLALQTETSSDGSFSAGPLYDDISYNIEASKPGYHIKQAGPNSFTCQKLGQILVRIYGEKEGDLLPSVLLSLSGEDGYRKNSVSGASGPFSFDNLFPGSFYLRPLLKEYSFSPAAVAIDLESGESRVVDFRATRVAYSAMGSVTLLSGVPKEGVFVEARSETKGFYEEATTDNLGNFRLRGLLPDTTYLIRAVAKENLGALAIERASPEYVAVNVGSEDIKGVDFIVFEQPEITILSGHVEGSDLDVLRPHLSVEIRSSNDPSKIQSVIPLPLSSYFEVRDLPKGKHLVQLQSRPPSNTHIFESEIVEVDLEKQPQIHVGPLKYKTGERHHKQELTPAPVFPLIVGVSVILLFLSMPRLKDLYQVAVGMAPLGSNTVPGKKEPRKTVLRKRA
uniref:Nodal modulator 1 n=1 Tax=Ananas comosus var. bracteatus TaxID=296719 RepID=A0A6V7PRQ1_ANACO|nr:unnamed protein product [Ananas comosus var. bracteatus]